MSWDLSFRVETVEAICLCQSSGADNGFDGDSDNGVSPPKKSLLVSLTTNDVTGWGEIYTKVPGFSHRHKARIVEEILAPLVVGHTFVHPAEMTFILGRETHRMAIEAGETGSFSHAIAGLDMAAWDAVARGLDEPLWRLLSQDGGRTKVPACAGGLNPPAIAAEVSRLRDAGWRNFKVRLGVSAADDDASLQALREAAGPAARIGGDASQAWDFRTAESRLTSLAGEHLGFVEEPITADRPWDEWSVLSSIGPPLSVGANISGLDSFKAAIDAGVRILQPDVTKWGGISGTKAVATEAQRHGVLWAPHGGTGGVALAASAHAAVACGGAHLEIDARPNAIHHALTEDVFSVADGSIRIHDVVGHGAVVDHTILQRYAVAV